MSCMTVKLKTHSRTNLTDSFDNINACTVHNHKPEILKVVAGRNKDVHFLAVCESDDCGKICMESAQSVVDIWNKFNPITL